MITAIIDGQHHQISSALIWVYASISVAITLAFYFLRSFGIYTMAKKKGLNNAFLAFIPCAWVYTACKLIGNVRTFGATFSKLALTFVIIFSIGNVLNFLYQFISYFPVVGNFLVGNELYLIVSIEQGVFDSYAQAGMNHLGGNIYGYVVNPYEKLGIERAVELTANIIYYITVLTDLAILVITISIYINLFRKYIPNHYVLFTILSVFGIFAPLVFAVRNKAPMNYSDYLRSRYNMWYAGGNPYGGQANTGAPQTPPTPFEEFAEKDEIDPGDPFSNFENKSSDKNDNDDLFN